MLSDRLTPSIFDAWPASAAVVICYSLPGPGCCLVGHRDMRGFKSSLVVLPAVAAPRKTTATRAGLKVACLNQRPATSPARAVLSHLPIVDRPTRIYGGGTASERDGTGRNRACCSAVADSNRLAITDTGDEQIPRFRCREHLYLDVASRASRVDFRRVYIFIPPSVTAAERCNPSIISFYCSRSRNLTVPLSVYLPTTRTTHRKSS